MTESFHRVRMPFGKHRGKLLGDVPVSYLAWLLRECGNMEPPLRDAVDAELRERMGAEPPRSPSSGVTRDGSHAVIELKSAIRSWYREMALRFHPDRNVGDDGKAMSAINHGYERLRELLKIE